MIFGYTLPEARKTLAALVISILGLVAYFLTFDPGLEPAIVAVSIAVLNVAGVFLSKNHTLDDVQKAVTALVASVLALSAFFFKVEATDTETILALVGAVFNVLAVYAVKNAGRARRA